MEDKKRNKIKEEWGRDLKEIKHLTTEHNVPFEAACRAVFMDYSLAISLFIDLADLTDF